MGFFFRKSIRLGGGLRLNLSKSGIGLSGGVKGFRLSTGPRGSFVNAGRGGFYFRQKIGGRARQRRRVIGTSTPVPVQSDYLVRASRRTWWVWQPLVAALIFFYSGIWPIGVAAVACAIVAFIHNSKVVDEEKAIDSTRDERVETSRSASPVE